MNKKFNETNSNSDNTTRIIKTTTIATTTKTTSLPVIMTEMVCCFGFGAPCRFSKMKNDRQMTTVNFSRPFCGTSVRSVRTKSYPQKASQYENYVEPSADVHWYCTAKSIEGKRKNISVSAVENHWLTFEFFHVWLQLAVIITFETF